VSASGWGYTLTPRAERDLDSMTVRDRRRIYEMLDRFTTNPAGSSINIQRVTNSREDWRLRAGRWRIVFRYDRPARMILVTRVLPRNERTYRR
jgi:mRNA-degrading endonuclease RelE of RelBE toxin-antitoxin system